MTQLLTACEKQVQDYEQQSCDNISDAIKLGVVLDHLPDASVREHLLMNSRAHDKWILMAAEIQTVAMARTTWLHTWPTCRSELIGPPPDIPRVAMDFCFANTESDDDVLTILEVKERFFQSAGATVLPDISASEFAVATIIGNLDFWGHQEVMIKCDEEQSMKNIAELLQEWRQPRRTILEYSPKGSQQSNGVAENAHFHLQVLLRTMRSDLMEKTGVNMNVKSLLVPWLMRHCAWSLTRFAIGADGQTVFKRQCGKNYAGETACFGEAIICHRIPRRIQTKMEPRWVADACSWRSWTCLTK